MSILISFLPWLVYWIFLSLRNLYLAIFGGLALALITNIVDLARRRPKVLKLGTLAFFFLMSIALLAAGPRSLGPLVGVLGPGALAMITLISIAVGKPFTLQYARDSAPPGTWNSPEFIRGNYVVTGAWLAAFLMMTAFSAGGFIGFHLSLLLHWVVSICCFLAALAFTHWYTARARRRREKR